VNDSLREDEATADAVAGTLGPLDVARAPSPALAAAFLLPLPQETHGHSTAESDTESPKTPFEETFDALLKSETLTTRDLMSGFMPWGSGGGRAETVFPPPAQTHKVNSPAAAPAAAPAPPIAPSFTLAQSSPAGDSSELVAPMWHRAVAEAVSEHAVESAASDQDQHEQLTDSDEEQDDVGAGAGADVAHAFDDDGVQAVEAWGEGTDGFDLVAPDSAMWPGGEAWGGVSAWPAPSSGQEADGWFASPETNGVQFGQDAFGHGWTTPAAQTRQWESPWSNLQPASGGT